MTDEQNAPIRDLVEVRNVILSTADKQGIDQLAPRLVESCPGVRFYSTGGTYDALRDVLGPMASQKVVEMTRYSTRPVMHSKLARTVDFKIYIGLLADPWNDVHVNDLSAAGAVFFDMVVSNSQPFLEDAAGVSPDQARRMMDIGGPGMIRAGVRNFVRVATVVDPSDYGAVADKIEQLNGHTDLTLRLSLARKALTMTNRNDAKIVEYLEQVDATKLVAKTS